LRSTAVRRTALAASAAALALLVTACGGDDKADKGGSGEDKGGAAAPSAPAAKALTAAELEKAALTQADVKTGKVTEKVPAAETATQDKVKADDEACALIAYVQNGSYVGKPSADVLRKWTGDPKKPAAGASDEEKFLAGMDAPTAMVTLASYEDGGAEQAMKDLNEAAKKCSGGFSATVAGDTTKVLKVVTTDAPKSGDEALALTVTIQADDVKAPAKSVIVRKGATLVYIPAFNIAAAATGKDFEFPTEILDAQLTKLG
jgi:hypothetical protein